MSKSLWPHKLQHARLPCPSLSSGVLLKLMSIESVMPSNHLILCCPLLFLPSIFSSIGVFSNELTLRIRWPKYWSFSISPSNEYSELISFRVEWLDLLAVQEFPALSQKQNLLLTVPFLVLRLSWAFSEVFSEDGRSRGMGSDLLRHFPCRRLLAWPIFPWTLSAKVGCFPSCAIPGLWVDVLDF